MEQRGKGLTTAHLWVFPVSANFKKRGGGQGQVKLMEGGQVKRSKVHKEETREGLIFHMRLLILHIKIIKISILFCLNGL